MTSLSHYQIKDKNLMKYKEPSVSGCNCGSAGQIHAAHCGCGARAEEFLAEPTAVYTASRRSFLRNALFGGLIATGLPVLTEEAHADLFMPGVDDQKKLGDQAAQEVLKKYHEVHDER